MQAQLLQLSSIIKRPKTDGARTNTLFQDGVLKLVTILTCSSVDFAYGNGIGLTLVHWTPVQLLV